MAKAQANKLCRTVWVFWPLIKHNFHFQRHLPVNFLFALVQLAYSSFHIVIIIGYYDAENVSIERADDH